MFDRSLQTHETTVPTRFFDELEHFAQRRVFGCRFSQNLTSLCQSAFILESFDDTFQIIFIRDLSEFLDEFDQSVNLSLFGLYGPGCPNYTVYTGDVAFPDTL
jgi:hypothetical protein